MNTQDLLTKKQAAKSLNVSQASLERLIRGDLKSVKLNRLVRFRPADLAEFIERNVRGGVNQQALSTGRALAVYGN